MPVTSDGGPDSLGQSPGPAPEILAALSELRDSFDSKIKYDVAKERQIEALHQELEGHRRGLYRQILQPVVADLISLYDEVALQRAQDGAAGKDGLADLLDMVETVLDRHGAVKFTCEGDTVDRSRQKVLDTQPTADEALGRRLARRLRPGFEFQGKVLRPEWVVAYRHVPDAAAPAVQAGEMTAPATANAPGD